MSKTRVYELAKQLNKNSKEIIKTLTEQGIQVNSHMSALEDKDVQTVLNIYNKEGQPKETPEKQAVKPQQPASQNMQQNTQPHKKVENQTAAASAQNQQKNKSYTGNEQKRTEGIQRPFDKNKQPYKKDGQQQTGQRSQQQGGQQQTGQRSQQQGGQQQTGQRSQQQGGQQQTGQRSQQQGGQQQTGQRSQQQGGQQQRNQQQTGQRNQQQGGQQQRNQQQTGQRNQQQGGQQQRTQQQGSNMNRNNKPGTNPNHNKSGAQNNPMRTQQTTTQSSSQSQTKSFNKNGQQGNNQGPQRKNNFNNNGPGNRNQNNRNQNNRNQHNANKKKQPAPKNIPVVEPPVEVEKVELISIGEFVTVKNLAEQLRVNSSEVIKKLMLKGVMANINQDISFEVATAIAEEYDVLVEMEEEVDILEDIFKEEPDKEADLQERPPVVVVMGHVDHGKTSLLDAIRKTSVTQSEAGGITQHIGAYTVSIDDKPITFLDTPGHEAFTAMRMRGAKVTDIAILVVAADDGVMPQTIEAINHAKAAEVDIIVAINKIDKPGANPDRVKQELTEYGLVAEDWGGQTICVPVSAMNKQGIDTLLEMVILVAEMKELKANEKKRARGTVVEAELDKGRGPVATVLVQSGTLRVGDPIVAGTAFGKVRAMMDDKGRKVTKAGPSKPVEILGLSEVPIGGDMFYVAKSDKQARQVADTMIAKGRVDMLKSTQQKISLDDLFDQIQAGNVKDLNIVVKADVQGSVEAVKSSLEKLSNEEVRIRTIHGGVGAVTESDVMLASASNAIIIGFNVRPEPMAKSVANDQKVDMRLYRVIYNAIEDITAAMKGLLDPIYEEKLLGHAELRQIFKASGVGTIGGAYVLDGKFVRNGQVRIVRDGIVIYEGEIETLRRFKDDVREVNTGYECGIVFKKFHDIKEGDKVECFVMEEIAR